jgi:hypothetical protein
MMDAIGDSLSCIVCTNDREDGEDKDDCEETEQGMLSEDEEPGWVMATITNMVLQHMERFWE